jgi:L-seryl-tRNA(Ser) seleniumtransferase
MNDKNVILRNLPKVDELINSYLELNTDKSINRKHILMSIREILDELRSEIITSRKPNINFDLTDLHEKIDKRVREKSRPSLCKVINATGVIIHTNLGRAPIAKKAVKATELISTSYSNLEYDIDNGIRGSRQTIVKSLLYDITGAENSMVVNNDAAAVFITLNTLAFKKEVIVSRGELIEIGDSFRIPEIIEKSGAIIREVGTTNKTKLKDYKNAINENTGLLLKVHPSNYRIMGFTQEVFLKDLKALSNETKVPLAFDLGSGLMIDKLSTNMDYEPTVKCAIKSGCDLVLFSGDKLLGGPQAGIIVGISDLIDKIKKNPIARIVRIDKMNLASLEGTLRSYYDDENAIVDIPVLAMLTKSLDSLKADADFLMKAIQDKVHELCNVVLLEGKSTIGGGSFPTHELPSFLVGIKPRDISVAEFETMLRKNKPPIITRVYHDTLFIDPRTLFQEDYKEIINFFEHNFSQIKKDS